MDDEEGVFDFLWFTLLYLVSVFVFAFVITSIGYAVQRLRGARVHPYGGAGDRGDDGSDTEMDGESVSIRDDDADTNTQVDHNIHS
jgi:hypothetical protein